MSSACTPILVGVVSPVSEIKLAYSPWSLKNLINLNRLKKFMQVGIDVKCMHTDFGGRGLSGFGDKISLRVHKSGKIQSIGIGSKNLCK